MYEKKRQTGWLLILLLALFLVSCSQSAEAAELATVSDVSGTVEWLEAEGQEWQPLEEDARLAPGAVVRTGPAGSARLDFPDESNVYLSSGAKLEIEQIDFGDDAERVIHLVQQSGVVRHTVHNGDSEPVMYTVSSPHGEARSLAGVFTLDAGVDDTAESRLIVSEGLVNCSNAGVGVEIGAGRMTFLRADEAPEAGHFVVYGWGEITQKGEAWTISDQSFIVTEQTVLVGALNLGDMAYVEGHVGEDGDLIADMITLYEKDARLITVDDEEIAAETDNACIQVTKRVADFDGTLITFHDGTTLSLDDVASVEGEIEIDAVLLIQTCTEDEGVTTIHIYELNDNEQIVLCHVPPGNPGNEHSIRVAVAAVDAHLAHGDYLGLCDDAEENVDNFEEYMDGDKVIVCHLPPGNPENEQSIRIGEPAVDPHLAHGDYLGLCDGDTKADIIEFDDDRDGGEDKVLLCHVPPGNPANEHEITVGEPAVDAHLAHGDYLGACTGAGGEGKGQGKNKNK